ncbi:hypothetical protein [uncultured Kordia sp.]|uniref:hypothetical protein n=1 Tax=uncultured Kordia sp. TaxID=507699 RepID=UPI00260A72B9|nr:hypothetical protein [uncultured Kordia sp.]
MLQKISFLFCVLCLISCKQEKQPKKAIETSQELDSIPQKEAIITVDETGFEPFDASEYLSAQLLIGRSEDFKKEKIQNLHLEGYGLFHINDQGLITARYDISNNYSEYKYTKDGLLKFIANKVHTPAYTHYSKEWFYKKDGSIRKAVEIRYDRETKQKTENIITDQKELAKENIPYSGGIITKEPFKINRAKRIMLSYGNDLVFCCGELMPGKNSLHYYYNENQLIDSLVINGLKSPYKKMTFKYSYNTD